MRFLPPVHQNPSVFAGLLEPVRAPHNPQCSCGFRINDTQSTLYSIDFACGVASVPIDLGHPSEVCPAPRLTRGTRNLFSGRPSPPGHPHTPNRERNSPAAGLPIFVPHGIFGFPLTVLRSACYKLGHQPSGIGFYSTMKSQSFKPTVLANSFMTLRGLVLLDATVETVALSACR